MLFVTSYYMGIYNFILLILLLLSYIHTNVLWHNYNYKFHKKSPSDINDSLDLGTIVLL